MDKHDAAPVPAVLRGAAHYLTRYGWGRGSYFITTPGTGTPLCLPACALGAIGMAAFGNRAELDPYSPVMEPAMVALAAAIDRAGTLQAFEDEEGSYGTTQMCMDIVVDFNDHAIDAEIVIDMLRAAADQYESEHAITAAVK